MKGGALMRVVGMCGGIVVLRTWRPPVAQAEVGPLSNAAREKRADPSLTWLERARKHVKSRTDSGFTDSQCDTSMVSFHGVYIVWSNI